MQAESNEKHKKQISSHNIVSKGGILKQTWMVR